MTPFIADCSIRARIFVALDFWRHTGSIWPQNQKTIYGEIITTSLALMTNLSVSNFPESHGPTKGKMDLALVSAITRDRASSRDRKRFAFRGDQRRN